MTNATIKAGTAVKIGHITSEKANNIWLSEETNNA